MSSYFLILIVFFLIACSEVNSSKIAEVNHQPTISNKILDDKLEINNVQTPKNEDSKTFDCSASNDYKVEKNRDEEFNLVNIIQDDKIVETIKLPTGLSQNGFALNWAKKTKSGFEMSIEYGSRFYYQKEFKFECKDHQLYLTSINITTFDKNDPEKSWKKRKTDINPNVLISNFKVTDYMTN
jgi:hypothetical protein